MRWGRCARAHPETPVSSHPLPSDSDQERLAWREAWRPCPDEHEYALTQIDGEIPREIFGTLYRNGPSQRVLPKAGYESLHIFDGDALVHAFRFENGAVHYTGRYARDAGFLHREAHGAESTGFGNAVAEHPDPENPLPYAPNTNVVWHGGRLLALVEAALPFELDPRSLESRGSYPFSDPMLGFSTSAHPKIDRRSGQMLIHGYQPIEPYSALYTIESDGRCSNAELLDIPYSTMMHDFAITENYVVVVLTPVTFELERGVCLRDWLRWEPEKGLRFGVRERTPGSPLRWFDAPSPGFIFHPSNAYEKDGRILMDACTYPDGGKLLEQLSVYRSGRSVAGAGSYPFLYEFDLSSGECHETQLDDRVVEFPRIDDRLVGYENRFGYALIGEEGLVGPGTSTLLKYQRGDGTSVTHDFGLLQYPSEPVFVPRAPNADEDDGFVLSVVFDGATLRSRLVVLDARNFAGAPLGEAHLSHRIPAGFHGNFAAGVV
jgi:carotenoid cleavage dioxygenase-like enzyme